MPIGGKLVLKGGEPLGGVKKKKKKVKKTADGDAEGNDGEQQQQQQRQQQQAPGVTQGKTYEQEFELEMARLKEGKARSTAWGSTFRAPPPVLHGYDRKVKGVTASERLDLRAASKADKFAK